MGLPRESNRVAEEPRTVTQGRNGAESDGARAGTPTAPVRARVQITVAALFVARDGIYAGRDGIDPWDEERDAMPYDGPHPVVAHPPCSRWCKLAGLVEARWGYKRGEDGGMFAHALDCVRRFGGVLEHPAYTDAFRAYGLGIPPRTGGWQREICGGWTCHVEQGRYGHPAKKGTYLYAWGVELPDLRWGYRHDSWGDKARVGGMPHHPREPGALVSWCGNTTSKFDTRRRLLPREAAATPPEFAEALIAMAQSAST